MQFSTVVSSVSTLGFIATAATAQTEAHVGALAGYGLEDAYQGAWGVTAGYLLPWHSRALYVGGRFARYFGTNRERTVLNTVEGLDDHATILNGTVGVRWITHPVEITTSGHVGVARFRRIESVRPVSGGVRNARTTETQETEFFLAPSLLVMLPLEAIKIGGEIEWLGVRDPFFGPDFDAQTIAVYGRVVVPFTVR